MSRFRISTRKILAWAAFCASPVLVFLFIAAHGDARPQGSGQGSITTLTWLGTTSFPAQGEFATQESGLEVRTTPGVDRQIPRSSLVVHVAAAGVPQPAGNGVVVDQPGGGFLGITHRDQRRAGTGSYANTQFSLEPPDQGLCVGNGFVVETVNDALRVFSTSGTPLTATTALNEFFKLKPAIQRGPPAVFGDFVADPRCYFDSASNRFFITALQIDQNATTGAFGPRSHVFIAVSQGPDPTQAFNIFSLDVTDDGNNGTPRHRNCPCVGDQPLIGADANGFHVSTNEFPLFVNGFNGAQIYAISKKGLEAPSPSPTFVHIDASQALVPFGGLSFSIQPASSPAGIFATTSSGTEYFLSSLDFNGTLDDRIAVWALTNTASLDAVPAVKLQDVVISSEVYGQPPNAQQRPGATPLGDAVHEPLEVIASNDDRMNQTVFADGLLWSGVNTVVKTPNGPTRTGLAFFVVAPSVTGGTLSATIANQGYVAVNQENVLYPSIAVSPAGEGVISITLVGPDFFPSAAYAKVRASGAPGEVHISGPGAGPEDGFSGYERFGGADVARWGDYTAAVVDADGTIWVATEFIPAAPRTVLANWGTFVTHVTP